jgi:hypothetical protein
MRSSRDWRLWKDEREVTAWWVPINGCGNPKERWNTLDTPTALHKQPKTHILIKSKSPKQSKEKTQQREVKNEKPKPNP